MENSNKSEKIIKLPSKASNFSEWYTSVLISSEFIDYSPVSGSLVFRPDSYFVWSMIQQAVDPMLKNAGIQDFYFPLLIPKSLLEKEAEHIKGFAPEVAWVTRTGNSELDEWLAIRPTSETLMYEVVSKWIRSWRDLPLKMNQWNNVLRWEFKHPTPFFRSREFLWNEGHTIYASLEEADAERDVILGIYLKVLKDYLALPGIPGRKTDNEKFAGALASYSIEHIIPDGNAIQGPDFHSDGQNFSKAFGIKFIDKEGNTQFAYQNTFAISTREIGVMVAVHGDDKGLIIPPRLARIQVVIIPIYNNANSSKIISYAKNIEEILSKSFRCYVDDRDNYSPGWKFNEWELKGVPVRIEVGAREVESKTATITRRDTFEKASASILSLENFVSKLLDSIHENLYNRAKANLEASIHYADTYESFKEQLAKYKGFISAPWCGNTECELKIKEETGAKATNMPFDNQPPKDGARCIYCGKEAKHIVNFAKSY
ncbi:MAG: proline--tRNA ligase [Candidatus Micrarchaeia archaeon]